MPACGNHPRLRYICRIAVATAPDVEPTEATSAAIQFLPLSLVDLVRELRSLARRDASFGRAAKLAVDLEHELTRLTGVVSMPRAKRRRAAHRATAARVKPPRLLEEFQAETSALDSTCRYLHEQGISISSQQLSDLRLGERTRRIFSDAGLLHVQDVASLPAEHAVDIPQLAPANVAEVRAAIMFSLEAAGNGRLSVLTEPSRGGDLFEGLVSVVNQLPPREREVVVLRTGVNDHVHEPEDVAKAIGCSVDQVPHFERRALNTLLSHPSALDACWRLEDLCVRLGLGWQDERLQTVVAAEYANTRASFTPLVTWLMREKARLAAEAGGRDFAQPVGIPHFEEMVVAALGRYGDLAEATLTGHVRAALTPPDREHYADVEVSQRVRILGPAVENNEGVFRLPDAPIPGVDDRHIRALNGLIGALQRLGSSRISSLTTEVNRRLPRAYHVNEQFLRTWLTRHPELFTQSDTDRFQLATLDVDMLCGMATSWMPGSTAPAVVATARAGGVAGGRLRERVAVEITEFLKREGPQSIGRIRSHLYGRILGASADTVIAERPQRFQRLPSGVVSLREPDEADASSLFDMDIAKTETPTRARFWQRR